MSEGRIARCPVWSDPQGQVMKTPDDVAAMVRLKACGWGLKRIAAELGCSHHTVKRYVAAGGFQGFQSPKRAKALDGEEAWLRERFLRRRGNADVVRQELLAEKGLSVSLRTLERAVRPFRQAMKAEALATVRFETPPGRQPADRFWRASGRGGGRQGQGVRVRCDARAFAPLPRAGLPG